MWVAKTGRMRYICHPEWGREQESETYKEKGSNPQEYEKNKCLIKKNMMGYTESIGAERKI